MDVASPGASTVKQGIGMAGKNLMLVESSEKDTGRLDDIVDAWED